ARDMRDTRAISRLWDELERWVQLEPRFLGAGANRDRRWFMRTLIALASEAGLGRTPRGPGRVRILSASLARGLHVPYLFVMGLGERSFPRLVAPEVFFEESELEALEQAGLSFPAAGDPMADEMLLFYQVV